MTSTHNRLRTPEELMQLATEIFESPQWEDRLEYSRVDLQKFYGLHDLIEATVLQANLHGLAKTQGYVPF